MEITDLPDLQKMLLQCSSAEIQLNNKIKELENIVDSLNRAKLQQKKVEDTLNSATAQLQATEVEKSQSNIFN